MDLRRIKGDKGQLNMVPVIASVIIAVVAISLAVIISDELITSQYTNFGINASDPTDSVCNASAVRPTQSGYCSGLQGGFNATRSLTAGGLQILPVVILVLAALPVLAAVYLLGFRT